MVMQDHLFRAIDNSGCGMFDTGLKVFRSKPMEKRRSSSIG